MPDSPVLVVAAINGFSTRAQNPHTPVTPEAIAADAIACLDAGASIVHTHNTPVEGPPRTTAELVAEYAAAYEPILARHPDAILSPAQLASGPIEDRYALVAGLAERGLIRMVPVDTGAVVSSGRTDEDGLPARDIRSVYTNTFHDARYQVDFCRERSLAPNFSVFEPGWLRIVLAFVRSGLLPAGALINFYFGSSREDARGRTTYVSFGLPPTALSLSAYLAMTAGTRLPPWTVAALGADLCATPLAAEAIAAGGHLRVGLEDYHGASARTNAALVHDAVRLIGRSGRRVATPAETSSLLGLPSQPRAR